MVGSNTASWKRPAQNALIRVLEHAGGPFEQAEDRRDAEVDQNERPVFLAAGADL